MTLSLQNHPSPWNRTLPKLSEAMRDTFPHHETSLLRHHITSKDTTSDTPIDPGYVRRSTVAHIPHTHQSRPDPVPQRSHSTVGHALPSDTPQYLDQPSRKRQASVMSTDTYSPSSSPSETGPSDPSQFCLCQPEPKIPRPRNAFILYRQHQHAGTVAQHPGLPNPDISKIIGEQWRLMPDKAKEEWKALAEEEKVRHSQQYPDYRYKPKRNSRVNSHSSSSGQPSQSISEGHTPCQKCGGKVMNAPLTPYLPLPQAPNNIPTMAGIPPARHQGFTVTTTPYPRMPATQQTVSPPHSARVRQYAEVFGQQPAMRHNAHNARVQYIPVQQQNDHIMVSPDAKRRRFNNSVFVQGRPNYHEPQYHYAPHEMGPPPRNMLVQAQPQLQQIAARPQQMMQQPSVMTQKPQSHSQRDPSLTLPPLQTPLGRPRASSQSTDSQSQKSGIEAMIRTIPVLNKLKILSQIAPQLAGPGPASPPHETRGAILAVEGMDRASVMNMTASLAEQLGRDGKFAVRIFDGPNPYATLNLGRRSSHDNDDYSFTSLDFLNVISEWHKISREMVEYITHKPGDKASQQVIEIMDDDEPTPTQAQPDERSKGVFSLDFVMKSPGARPPTPPSAISPKTMQQASELSLRSPPIENPPVQEMEEGPRRKSRIPAAALAMQAQARKQAELEAQEKARASEAEAEAIRKAQAESEADVSPENQPDNTSSAHRSPMALEDPSATKTTNPSTAAVTAHTSFSANAIPIAIVPHYQLTTVDASAIAMPITDAYSPHSHWQWLATIWRGCVGPDVTIVIKGPNDDVDANMSNDETGRVSNAAGAATAGQPTGAGIANASIANGNNTTATPANPNAAPSSTVRPAASAEATGPAVEVRLLDCRAVIVRTGMAREVSCATSKATSADTGASAGTEKKDITMEAMTGPMAESWEKAKRRVGFEVEEFLRR